MKQEEGYVMNCTRCQGLMTEDHFFDCEDTEGLMWMRGWRCVNCGHAVDPLIEANRRLQEMTVLALPHEEPEYKGTEVYLEADRITRVAA